MPWPDQSWANDIAQNKNLARSHTEFHPTYAYGIGLPTGELQWIWPEPTSSAWSTNLSSLAAPSASNEGFKQPSAAGCGQAKEPPQAHELWALGLSMVKPCFSMVSAKSIVAPSR